ncbi:HAD-IA family hydrolase [Thalassomonas actiniarum]|uniref:HAD-IA family hydrolase n=1 Tax=Thalassomonas actiniarum TaxID=485447 RepID=A0AAE9YPR1_9GAMM|nr:HAD-IA family hydrolase [Thalassomonas actiniarum]WDD99004.1 HAD-IA family hydrolase [Thalassomonas actiniarum]
MKLYRRLQPVKAISFDLDDTLYSNYPVMMAANAGMAAYFATVPDLQPMLTQCQDINFWFFHRARVLQQQPALKHDVSALRIESYYLGFLALNFTPDEARLQAKAAMAEFVLLRSNIDVPPGIHAVLAALAEQYPLVAISNGNVDTRAIGLDGYFQGIYHAGKGIRQKPALDMFALACEQLAIAPGQLLHVGDCGRADIFGAAAAGCQSAWFPTFGVGKPLTVLPDIELTEVGELSFLLI